MIVVSGEPRSGTSLMMMVLRELGFSIAGQQWPPNTDHKHNPLGQWEIERTVMHGTRQPIKEDAIKMVTSGLLRTNKILIDKIIFCIRDPREIVESTKMSGKTTRIVELGLGDPDRCYRYYNKMISLLFFDMGPKDWEKVLVVDHHDMLTDSANMIEGVSDFLNVEPTLSALSVIKPHLYRARPKTKINKESEEWYNKLKEKIHGNV